MPVGRFVPPDRDRAIGLGFYVTDTPGLDARVKRSPDDFRVSEISLYPMPDPHGAFTILRVRSTDWEQHELAERIARKLGLSLHALSWAGTKDRRAVAERLFSYRGTPPERAIGLPGVEVLEAYRARDGLVLGRHFGNTFAIRLLPSADTGDLAIERIAATTRALQGVGGFPNFFGPQRFGEVRPVTHEVGRELVRGDVDAAVRTYLAAPSPGPDAQGEEARAEYARHGDAARALREFPPAFRFERQLLDHLARGHTAGRAMRALGRELRLLFVHAYQSLLFNRWLSLRFQHGLSLDRPVEGDTVLRVRRDGTVPGTDAVPVESDNLSECTELVARGGARVAGPLVGTDTPERRGTGGALLESILSEEGVARSDFALPASPEIASRGSWRPISVPLPPLGIAGPSTRESESGPTGVVLTFALPKGSYATVLLREFLKDGASELAESVTP